jgi:addiction module RelE/StbE family toxin
MQVRWTSLSAQDLQRITSYIRRNNSVAARRIAKALYDGAMSLDTLPDRGHVGRIAGTRELVFDPFIIVYRVKNETVEILRIYHAAQDWP